MDSGRILNTVNDYNSNYYPGTGYTKFEDYINNKYDNVHDELYKEALEKFKSTLNFSDDTCVFTEIKNEEYNKPSSVRVTKKIYPFLSKVYDLSYYWNKTNYNKLKNRKLSNVRVNGETINDWVITYVDYARGKVIIYSKMYDIEREASFEDVNYGNFTVLKENTLSNTFASLRKKY